MISEVQNQQAKPLADTSNGTFPAIRPELAGWFWERNGDGSAYRLRKPGAGKITFAVVFEQEVIDQEPPLEPYGWISRGNETDMTPIVGGGLTRYDAMVYAENAYIESTMKSTS